MSDRLGYNFTVFILKTKPLKGRSAAPMQLRDNIEKNNDNNHTYKSCGITFTVTDYAPIKLIISKYSPFVTFMMHKCTIKETSLLRDSKLIGNGCT